MGPPLHDSSAPPHSIHQGNIPSDKIVLQDMNTSGPQDYVGPIYFISQETVFHLEGRRKGKQGSRDGPRTNRVRGGRGWKGKGEEEEESKEVEMRREDRE